MRKILFILVCVTTMVLFTGCSNDDEYRDTLTSGLEKYYNNDNMSREEYNAVKSYNSWKSKQGNKKYSDWDN